METSTIKNMATNLNVVDYTANEGGSRSGLNEYHDAASNDSGPG